LRGDPVGGLEDVRDARDISLRHGLARFASVATNNLADGLLWTVGVEPARETFDEAIAFSHERGLSQLEWWQRGERLRCLYHGGEWEETLEAAQEVLDWAEERGGGPLVVYARVPIASVLVHRGAIDRASDEVERLLPAAREGGDPQVVVPGHAVAALVASASGRIEEALAHVSELERATRDLAFWRSTCLAGPAQIALAAGERELAEGFLEGSDVRGAWSESARATALASLAAARGDTDEAVGLFREAAARWGEWGSVVERAYALLGMGRCGDAAARLEGEAVFERLGASPLVAEAA
jgi:tetratricopeptide (TPR) repeat protein